MQLGLQLPRVIPLMPVVSLNTSGCRPLKSRAALCAVEKRIKDALRVLAEQVQKLDKQSDSEDRRKQLAEARSQREQLLREQQETPMHWDSRVDKFNQRLHLIRKQFRQKPDELVQWERELRDVSLYEFCWKYSVYRGVIKRSVRSVAIMVTPSFSADCANVEHKNHENYARVAVVAYWRLMGTKERCRLIRAETENGRVRSIDDCFIGATQLEHPSPRLLDSSADRFLGTADLFVRFEGERASRWGVALMEMLVDPLLSTWVPDWVTAQ